MGVILLTGGSRGIGAAAVRDLVRAGHEVALTYARASAIADGLVDELGADRVAAVHCELADPRSVGRTVDAAVARFGRLDVLVNNGAIYADNPFDGDDLDAWRAGWRRTFDVNVFGTVDLTWFALRAMRRNAPGPTGIRGRIVNVTSRAAHRGETSFADYGASKAALANFTRSLARGCASDGIVAFNVAPGFIATDMAAEGIAAHGDRIRAEIPSGRIGTPEEVASVIAALASGGFDYATGTTIDINGASYVR